MSGIEDGAETVPSGETPREIGELILRNSLFFGGLVREFADLTCQQGPRQCIHRGLPMAGFWKDGMICRKSGQRDPGECVA